MMGIRDKLLMVIGEKSVNQWARDNNLSPQTVHEWIQKDRIPRSSGFNTLIKSTGIPKEWWLYGVGDYPKQGAQKTAKHYEKSDKATALKLKTPEVVFVQDGLDPLLMHHVIVSVEKMLKKHGKELDATKKADLFFLIYDYSKAAGGMDEEMVERFVNVAG
ncbi:MAG: hypothetical protein JNL77_03240 [Nitrosomonas sp.]|nr:hypothetical protein [Nitrosomonas sp.]